ncbi:hypothetical protein [Candidatus Regiella endosymbiont of Tuberolachnus salignus]|uniref:hypothetical protein n=1 Tax=Candidatus Regiella endosymbiont of Tuberolachnus salignus TaxID=3077956 RepID=UPI0030CB42D8
MPDIAPLSTEGSEEAQSGSPDGIRSPRDQIIELCMGDYAKTPQEPLSQECKNAIESLTDFKNVNFQELIKTDKKNSNLFQFISLEKLPEVFELILKRANESDIEDAFMHLTEALSTGNPSYFSEYRYIYPREIEQFIQNEITVTGYSAVMSPYSFAQKRDIQIITRGLNAVIGSLKKSDSAFDKAAVELHSWAEEPDVKPNEKRFDALERILIHLTKKRSHGLKLDLSGLGFRVTW